MSMDLFLNFLLLKNKKLKSLCYIVDYFFLTRFLLPHSTVTFINDDFDFVVDNNRKKLNFYLKIKHKLKPT
jgi:hypothetical protein